LEEIKPKIVDHVSFRCRNLYAAFQTLIWHHDLYACIQTQIMENALQGKKVAILATHGFEQSELQQPLEALIKAGAAVEIVSLKKGKIKAWKDKNWGDEFEAVKSIDEVKSNQYDALVLPGGVMNPDSLRVNEDAVNFVADFLEEGKPLAAICHGPWTMIETGLLKGRRVTSYQSIKTDLENAGAIWEDEEVLVDNGLVTSRSPKDLPAFCKKMIEEIMEGVHD
jgi:protease I